MSIPATFTINKGRNVNTVSVNAFIVTSGLIDSSAAVTLLPSTNTDELSSGCQFNNYLLELREMSRDSSVSFIYSL